MASKWGRDERIIWPPHAPIYTYAAMFLAFTATLLFVWQQEQSLPILERSYLTDYIRSGVGALVKQQGKYSILYVGGAKRAPRLAVPADFEPGRTRMPDGRVVSAALSSVAVSEGFAWFYRAPAKSYQDASMNRWLRDAIFEGKSLVRTFRISLVEGAITLLLLLIFSARADVRRFKELKYGRRLKGPFMLTPREFNRSVRGKGIGFQTTEMSELLRIPLRKEAQHFQLMGDTGAGKTTLITQMLRQIEERKDAAIIYDPAGEYVQRFYNATRGDWVLNPLDARGPYWGPAEEMRSNTEADAIAASLYQPTTDMKDEFFHKTLAQIFAHLLKQGPTPHQLAKWMASEQEILRRVEGTEMEHYISQSAGPQRAGVLSSLGLVAKSLRLLPTKEEARGKVWSATEWAKHREGWIFITSRPTEREALRPLHSLWIDLLVMRLLSKPEPGQKQVWFVIDELASLQRLPQLHTAITENRKSRNPLVLGFQGKSQLEVIYGHLAEVMLSQPATKIFLATSEPKAAEWVSNTIGKVEIERVKETKFDGTRKGHNFSMDRQIEPLVMDSEIEGLDDKHAYLKLGNNVTRFAFEYMIVPERHPACVPRNAKDDVLTFDPLTLQPKAKPPQPAVSFKAAAPALPLRTAPEATFPAEARTHTAEAPFLKAVLPIQGRETPPPIVDITGV